MNKFEEALKRIADEKRIRTHYLDLSHLQLSHIPEEVFELDHLYDLNLSFNYLVTIPEDISNLKYLRYLDITSNCLRAGCAEYISNLEFLRECRFEENFMEDEVPIEVLQHGILAVSNFLDARRQFNETEILSEVKILFVGNGEVGKTTLIKKLIDPFHDVKVGFEPSTHGVEISQISIDTHIEEFDQFEEYEYEYDYDYWQTDGVIQVKCNLWDFGGQEIYHSTHQFFLTNRSIYIYVWEARREDENQTFEYWLNIVKYLSNGSPIIIVLNKSDQRIKSIDESSLKRRYPSIISFLSLSCVTNEGLDELQEQIYNTLYEIPHLQQKLPTSWMDVKRKLQQYDKNYIDINEYYSICESYKINEIGANSLSAYLHDIGVFLHFKKDRHLRNILILNPDWVTKAVYKIIDNRQVQLASGKFEYMDLKSIWTGELYPIAIHQFLLDLMEKFELCFNLPGTDRYIVPELLSAKKLRTIQDEIPDQKTLKLEIQYNFLPAGIISRLICRLHHYVSTNFWKDGVVFKYETSETIVEGDRLNKKILINITGTEKSQFLAIIRNELDIIHGSLNFKKEIDFYEMLPCNCILCFKATNPNIYKYSDLRRLLDKQKTKIICVKSGDEISLLELVKGYEHRRANVPILQTVLSACSKLQGNHKYISTLEDARNKYVADLIDGKIGSARDQTKWGQSETGKTAGEVDIKLEDNSGMPLAIFEGLNLTYLDNSNIKRHLLKIFNYDPNGLKENYLLIYLSGEQNIDKFYSKYFELIKSIETGYINKSFDDISERYSYGSEVKICRQAYERSGLILNIYHIIMKLNT